MSSESLVFPEARNKIEYLLGSRASAVFVCFTRILYSKRDSIRYFRISVLDVWMDDNLMGYFVVLCTRGFVKGYQLYSALLFDHEVTRIQFAFIVDISSQTLF